MHKNYIVAINISEDLRQHREHQRSAADKKGYDLERTKVPKTTPETRHFSGVTEKNRQMADETLERPNKGGKIMKKKEKKRRRRNARHEIKKREEGLWGLGGRWRKHSPIATNSTTFRESPTSSPAAWKASTAASLAASSGTSRSCVALTLAISIPIR